MNCTNGEMQPYASRPVYIANVCAILMIAMIRKKLVNDYGESKEDAIKTASCQMPRVAVL